MTCDLAACRTCTGCAHGHHAECRRTVRCPNDRDIRTCDCCGRLTAVTTTHVGTADHNDNPKEHPYAR